MSSILGSEDSISHYLHTSEDLSLRQLYQWVCPVCKERFKWDTQLRRHQDRSGHQNPNRVQRRQQRGHKQNKMTEFPCKCCGEVQKSKISLLNHRQWCLNDPEHGYRAKYYASSWSGAIFECTHHEIPYYYSSVEQLQCHISHHKIKNPGSKIISQIPIQKKKINYRISEQLRRQFQKYRRLTADQAQRIAMAKKISITTVRRYFRRFKNGQF